MQSMYSKFLARLLMLLLSVGAMATGHAAPTGKILPLAQALKAATAAQTACAAKGHHVTVTVIDRQGITRVQLVGDGAGAISIRTSYRKAFAAAALGMSTADMQKLPTGIDPDIYPIPGGLPLRSGSDVLGAIGVGGADGGGADEECAKIGVDAIATELR